MFNTLKTLILAPFKFIASLFKAKTAAVETKVETVVADVKKDV